MRQQIRLTESELQNIIEESVRRVIAENMEDEFKIKMPDFISDRVAGIRNSTSGDIERVKTAAKGIGPRMDKLYRDTKAKVKKGIDDRKAAYGAGVNAAKNKRYIENAVNALRQLQQLTDFRGFPLFDPKKPVGQSVSQTINLLNGGIKGHIAGEAASYRNQIGR